MQTRSLSLFRKMPGLHGNITTRGPEQLVVDLRGLLRAAERVHHNEVVPLGVRLEVLERYVRPVLVVGREVHVLAKATMDTVSEDCTDVFLRPASYCTKLTVRPGLSKTDTVTAKSAKVFLRTQKSAVADAL